MSGKNVGALLAAPFLALAAPMLALASPFLTLAASVVLAGAAHAQPAAGVPVTPVDAAGLQRAIAAQKGKVVVVNFWATYCGPCMAEFPRFVQLAQKDRGAGLVVFAVSADSLRDVPAKVRPFLTKQGGPLARYIVSNKDPEQFIDGFDPSWQGDLPRTYVYDRLGRRVKTLSGEQTATALAQAVAPYLKQ